MSEVFHKSCYTSRSPGYKYRTLSTNTGERKRRDREKEDSTFDKKFKELKREITCRIDQEVNHTQKARELIQAKVNKIDAKINSMLKLQDAVLSLRNDLQNAVFCLSEMVGKVDRLEALGSFQDSDPCSLQSRKSSFPSQPLLGEDFSSTMTRIRCLTRN